MVRAYDPDNVDLYMRNAGGLELTDSESQRGRARDCLGVVIDEVPIIGRVIYDPDDCGIFHFVDTNEGTA